VPTVAAFDRYETAVPVDPGNLNPFDPAQISVVAIFRHGFGKEFMVPAFWHRAFSEEPPDAEGAERFAPQAEGGFRLRFSLPIEGQYEYRITATTAEGTKEVHRGTLLATAPKTGGPLRRGKSPRYLENSAGQGVFLIGQNIAWSSEKAQLRDLLRYIDEMSDTGQNFMRLWLCSWCLGYEHQEMGRYGLARAWQLDQIVERAEKRGVYIILCFENFHDVREKKSPYWARDGGNGIRAREEFFTSAEARRAFQNRLQYALARWGHSRAIAAWELFNEMEYTVLGPLELDSSVRDKYFRPWLDLMQAHVRRWDAHGHLLTNSLATDRIWDDMNRMAWLDIAQHHIYLNSWDSDDAGKVLQNLARISDYGKPYMLGEYGGAAAGVYGAKENIVNQRDKEGIHLHNGIWAGALSGSCATPLMWWWDEYVRPNKLYFHYAALSKFLVGTPWLDPTLRPEEAADNAARVLVLRGDQWALVWAQNRSHTWESVGAAAAIRTVTPGPLRFANLTPGRYRVEWWDTYNGTITRREERQVTGELLLDVPEIRADVAMKIVPVGGIAK
jgi:hypothetical protein